MSEFVEAAAAAGSVENAALVGGGLAIAKVLGPSVSAVGKALGDFTDYRLRNLLRLDDKIRRRLDAEPSESEEDPDQTVHPRVAKEILDEGSWIEDDLHQEYLAGLMLGARSKNGASDSQAYLARVVTQMTTAQVRLHYAVVSAYAGYWDGQGECPFPFHSRNKFHEHAVTVNIDEVVELVPEYDIAVHGLSREGFLSNYGRPLGADGQRDLDRTAFVPTLLAFDVYLEALARPGRLSKPGLLLSREALAAANTAITYPDPEPPLFQSAVITAVR